MALSCRLVFLSLSFPLNLCHSVDTNISQHLFLTEENFERLLPIQIMAKTYFTRGTDLSQFFPCFFVLRKQVFTGNKLLKDFKCNFSVSAIKLFLASKVFQLLDDFERILFS